MKQLPKPEITAKSARKYHQGLFVPKNPSKYVGDVSNIIYRSGWELKLLMFFDLNPNVLSYQTEEMIVVYRCRTDNKIHRYFPDFVAKVKTKTGEEKIYMIEVKPYAQTQPPVLKKNKKRKTIINETFTYAKNVSKWEAANAFCKKKGWEFMIITEKNLDKGIF